MKDVIPTTEVEKLPRSKQYDLFTQFYGDALELSNTIELWDSLPLYSKSRKKQEHLRDENGRLSPLKLECVYRPTGRSSQPINVAVRIQAASIDQDDGSTIDIYPSSNEEVILEVLRKIFCDQLYGFHHEAKEESWVFFTISMIRKELQARGRSRSHDEIMRSLQVLRRCHIEIKFDGQRKAVYSEPILSTALEITRSDWIADPHARWAVRLPLLLSRAINQVQYRQFNYGVQMSLKSQLARWLHKRLCHNYSNASVMRPYHISYTSIERDSQMLNHSKDDRNMKTVANAWQELVDAGVIYEVPEPKPTEDLKALKYEAYPTSHFVDEVKAANGRKTKAAAMSGDIAARKRIAARKATSNE